MPGMSLYAIPLVALLELWLLITVGSKIGVLATVGLVFLTGIIGVTLLRQQGFQLLNSLQMRMSAGEMPARELMEGVALLIGGFCLLTPGFLTDTLGFLLLLPPTRKAILLAIEHRLRGQLQGGMSATGHTVFQQRPETERTENPAEDAFRSVSRPETRAKPGQVLDGEYTRED